MAMHMEGWKNIWEVEVPPVKKKGFSQDVVIRAKVEPKKVKVTKPVQESDDKTVLLQDVVSFDEMDGTVLLNDQDKTVILSEQKRLVILLTREKTNETVEIDKTPFVIGKSSTCDYMIDSNPTISRRHAQIMKKNGDYYLEDLGSSNHTFVDEKEITEPVRVIHNMVFSMSDEEFRITVELK